jgi:predicted site-specific integrase-resolvase
VRSGRTDDHISEIQAANRLGVSRHLVLVFAAAGQLHAVPMGGRLFYQKAEVDALRVRLAEETAARSSE